MLPGIYIGIAAVLLVAAVVLAIIAFDKESVVAVGATVILAAGGIYLFVGGVQRYHAGFRGKHADIYRDLTREGFTVPYESVYARGGNNLYGTEADLAAGGCLWSFNASKINGRWRLTLPRPNGNGVEILTPAAVAKLAAACPS